MSSARCRASWHWLKIVSRVLAVLLALLGLATALVTLAGGLKANIGFSAVAVLAVLTFVSAQLERLQGLVSHSIEGRVRLQHEMLTRSRELELLLDHRGPVREAEPSDVHVAPSPILTAAERNAGRRLYVPRDVDKSISDRLSRDSIVLVIGPSMAGKSKSLFEVLRTNDDLREHLLIVPSRFGLERTTLSRAQALLAEEYPEPNLMVLWLDDLKRYLVP